MSLFERPLRIALFHNLPAGGAKRHTYEQVRELARRGHTVEEFTFSTSDREFMSLRGHVSQTHVYPLRWNPLRPVPIPGAGPYLHLMQNLMNFYRLDRVARQVAADIDAGDFDLVFAKDCMFTLAPQIMRYVKPPCVFYAHSFLNVQSDIKSFRGRDMFTILPIYFHTHIVHFLDIRNARHAKLVLTNSRSLQTALGKRYGVTITTVYPGVDIHSFKPAVKPRRDYVLSVGTITEQKGHRLVVEALGLLPVETRPMLIVAGAGGSDRERQLLMMLASSLNVSIEIREARTTQEMANLYGNAFALVVGHIYQYLGNNALEAASCGTPIVAVDPSGMVENVKDRVTGILVKTRTAEALAGALGELLQNPERAEAMGRAGRAYIESYWTWPRAVDDLEAQFAVALGKP